MPDIAKIREMMPGTLETVYLNTGTCGPMPRVAFDAMVDELRNNLSGGRASTEHFMHLFELWGGVREAVAGVVKADPSEIAITNRTTDGMYVSIMGYPWQRGDELILSNIEHPGGLLPSFLAKKRFGVRIKVANVGLGGGDPANIVKAFEEKITPRTKMIMLSHVSYTTGAALPVKEITAMAHAHDVLVAVDAAQSYGALDLDMHDLDVDFYACPGQKWLCGPDGTGALYVKASSIGELEQNFAGGIIWGSLDYYGGAFQAGEGASRFDSGGWNTGLLAGQKTATEWISNELGMQWATNRIQEMAGYAYSALQETDGVTMVTPREAMAGLIAFTVDKLDGPTLMERLKDEHNVTIRYVTKYINNPDAARVSVGFYNNEDDIEKLVTSIQAVRATAE
jgi:L-cysteine/cystine lyase